MWGTMRRLRGAAVFAAGLVCAIALGGCTAGGGNNAERGLRAIAEAAGSSSFHHVRDAFGEITAAVDMAGRAEIWVWDGEDASEAPEHGEPWWSVEVPDDALTLEAVLDAWKELPSCEESLVRSIVPVGKRHQLVTSSCFDPTEDHDGPRIPDQYYDGEQLVSGTVDLLDPEQLTHKLDEVREILGVSTLASVKLLVGSDRDATILGVTTGRSVPRADGKECLQLLTFSDTITEVSGGSYRTSCDSGDGFPIPSVPFDPGLALTLWRDSGGASDSGGTIGYEVQPDDEPRYTIRVGSNAPRLFTADGVPEGN